MLVAQDEILSILAASCMIRKLCLHTGILLTASHYPGEEQFLAKSIRGRAQEGNIMPIEKIHGCVGCENCVEANPIDVIHMGLNTD